jgi:hypothetical protein
VQRELNRRRKKKKKKKKEEDKCFVVPSVVVT